MKASILDRVYYLLSVAQHSPYSVHIRRLVEKILRRNNMRLPRKSGVR